MTRLINNKGTWQLQISKTDNKAIALLFSNMPRFLEVAEETPDTFTFEFSHDWDYGGMESCSESDYRNTLAKISENPDPDLIIPCEEIPEKQRLIHHHDIFRTLISEYPKQKDIDFLINLGIDSKESTTTFKFTESNHLRKSYFRKFCDFWIRYRKAALFGGIFGTIVYWTLKLLF